MSSCDTTKDVVRTASSNTSLGSLGGSESEGIGSAAEGEFHSSGESTHGEDIEQRNEINKGIIFILLFGAIMRERLRWIEHVLRKKDDKLAKIVLSGKS